MNQVDGRQDPISTILGRVEALSGTVDRAFIKMAEVLPALGSDLAQMTGALEGCMAADSIRTLHTHLHDLGAWGVDLSSVLGIAAGVRQQASERSNVLVSIGEALSAKLVGILPMSATLRLIAINASAAAARGGSRAAGFAVLTRELDAVARTSLKAVPDIRRAAEGVSQVAKDIVKAHADLHVVAEDLHLQNDRIGDVIRGASETLASLEHALGPALDGTRAASPPLGRIMVAAQRQDIVRQKFEHVVMALREVSAVPPCQAHLSPSNGSHTVPIELLEPCWLRSRLCRLIGRLLHDALKDVESLCREVGGGLGALESAAAPLRQLRSAVPDSSVLEERFRGPVVLLGTILSSRAKIMGHLGEQAAAAEKLVPLAQSMQGALSTLGSLNHLLGSINVQIKIEMSGPRFFATQASLSEDIDRLRIEYGQSIRLVSDDLATIMKLSRWVGDVARTYTDDHGIERLTHSADSMINGLQKAASTFGAALERSMRIGLSLSEKATGFRESVEAMQADASQGASIVRQCDELADRADDVLNRTPLAVRKALDQRLEGRLQALVAKFSVLSHKSAARDLASVTLDHGDAPGTLTLF